MTPVPPDVPVWKDWVKIPMREVKGHAEPTSTLVRSQLLLVSTVYTLHNHFFSQNLVYRLNIEIISLSPQFCCP